MYIENKQLKNHISFWLFVMFWTISIMIVVGGLTRLTDSGLSITQWQLFSGFLPPINESQWLNYFNLYKEIPEFKLQNYSMNLQEFKVIFWWEWIHRFLGRLIGLFFLIPLIYFSFKVGIRNIKSLHLIFILKKIKKKSIQNNIDPKITNRIWKSMIWSYIDYEKRKFKKK